jgi:hypothetical protein
VHLRVPPAVQAHEGRAGGNDNSYKTATDYWRLQGAKI